jgi:hypothetical protein
MEFIARRIFIVKQFYAMGATLPDLIIELHRLIMNKAYFEEWDQVMMVEE